MALEPGTGTHRDTEVLPRSYMSIQSFERSASGSSSLHVSFLTWICLRASLCPASGSPFSSPLLRSLVFHLQQKEMAPSWVHCSGHTNSRAPSRGTTVASAERPRVLNRVSINRNTLGIFPPGHTPMARSQASYLASPLCVTVCYLSTN